MSWISPASHSDPSSNWTDETNAYDGDIDTYASATLLGWLELILTSPIVCDKVRINAARWQTFPSNLYIDAYGIVEVYYSGSWHEIFRAEFLGDTTLPSRTWYEIPIGSIQRVEKARVRYVPGWPFELRIFEFEFWETTRHLVDTNRLIRDYLTTSSILTDPLLNLIGGIADPRIYCPRLPEKATLPAISYFTRGGIASAELPHIFSPSVQFDCWADNPIDAREVYRALYDALQGLGSITITIAGTPYYIMKVREEVQGQDLVDTEIPNYFRVLTFYSITIRDTT